MGAVNAHTCLSRLCNYYIHCVCTQVHIMCDGQPLCYSLGHYCDSLAAQILVHSSSSYKFYPTPLHILSCIYMYIVKFGSDFIFCPAYVLFVRVSIPFGMQNQLLV